ncbi:MAG: membrane-associated phospholipid phosphatase [Saprospiraceae bacterium]|jgi:membrane-associated phospholipid phosphatase
MLKSIEFIALFFLSINLLTGQMSFSSVDEIKESPYRFKLGGEIAFVIGGAAGRLGGEAIISNITPFTEKELEALDANSVNAFDRSGTSQFSLSARTTSDHIRNATYALPLLLLFDKQMGDNWKDIIVIGGEALLVNSGVSTLSKGLFARARPIAYNENAPLEERLDINAKLSFISGHTSTTAVMSFVTAKMFSDFYPDSPLRPYFWGGASALTLATGYFRYKGGKHFFSDVLIGGSVGAMIGIFVPQLHKNKVTLGEATLGFVSDSGQVGLVLRW